MAARHEPMDPARPRLRRGRVLLAGVVAALVNSVCFTVLFGNPPVRSMLFEAGSGQSRAVLDLWSGEPAPAITPYGDVELGIRAVLVAGALVLWGVGMAAGFEYVRGSLPDGVLAAGAGYGVALWFLVFLFLEAWIPLNALHEPVRLVALELGLELVGMVVVGVVISALLRRPNPSPTGVPAARPGRPAAGRG